MSNALATERIRRHPRFHELVARRSRLSWRLALLVLALYYVLIFVVALRPGWLHAPLAAGGATTVGWPIGAAVIVVSWLLTGLYVHRSNTTLDALNDALVAEAAR